MRIVPAVTPGGSVKFLEEEKEEKKEKEKKEEQSLRTNRQEKGPPKVVQEVLADIKRIGIQKIPFAAHENLANMFYSELLVYFFNVNTWYLFWSFL